MTDQLEQLKTALADRYTIERELGSGGMATVYLARDLKHDRQVALKLLKPELGAVLGGERFLREIHIAASLNHPHILALHDSGEVDGFLFYVMPYVAGESLRQRLERETQLSIEQSIELCRQVAAALDYAHRQGVVHRDIKPENILLQEGQAVVADFGIARALRVAGGERLTETGLSLGTPHYMSPEQAGGTQELDGRTDVYALGCVLYEMLAGDPPFTGPTAPAIIARQLVDPVPSLKTVRPSVSAELEHAIEKALAKVPADRYDTAGEFVEAAGAAAQVEVVPTKERPVPRRRVSSKVLGGAATVAAAASVAAVVLFTLLSSKSITITTSNAIRVTNDPGLEFQPAISPDGQDVAFVMGPIRTPRILVRSAIDVGTGGQTHLAEVEPGLHWLPTWTPDGASLRFLTCQQGLTFGSGCDWKAVGKLGGSVRSAGVPRASTAYAWSSDGARMAFVVEDSIFAYSAGNGEPQLLGVHRADRWPLHSLTWSPDGQRIAYVNGNALWRHSANVMPVAIWMLDADGGEPVRVTDDRYMNVSPQWLPDSRHLLFVSNRDGARGVHVIEVGPDGPRGSPRSVLASSDAHSISLSADGRKLAYAKFTVAQNIWSVPIPRSGSVSVRDATPVTAGNQVIESHSLSPDGKWIVFDLNLKGEFDIYKQRLVGGRPELVADISGSAFDPAWSADGAEIAFYGGSPGPAAIWTVPASGGDPLRITDFPASVINPDWSPDGLAIAYRSRRPQGVGPYNTWVMTRDSVRLPWSDPVQLNDFEGCTWPKWAPDGERLVCRAGNAFVEVSREGQVLSRHSPSVSWPQFSEYDYSPDGSRIYFKASADEDGAGGLWSIPAEGGEAVEHVRFDDPLLDVKGFLTVGPEHFYLTIAEYESDIWVMDLEW